jgi:predicted nucleic acid-binding protein
VFEIVWVDEDLHRAATAAFLAAIRRGTSFVDRVSFELMRRRSIETAFAFDRDFTAEGFSVIP